MAPLIVYFVASGGGFRGEVMRWGKVLIDGDTRLVKSTPGGRLAPGSLFSLAREAFTLISSASSLFSRRPLVILNFMTSLIFIKDWKSKLGPNRGKIERYVCS